MHVQVLLDYHTLLVYLWDSSSSWAGTSCLSAAKRDHEYPQGTSTGFRPAQVCCLSFVGLMLCERCTC